MRLDTLENRMLYYRGLTDYKLIPKSYVILMLDGRSFSKFCKKFNKPYDVDFIGMMNETAKHLCKNIEGCKFAYTQSDEISLVLTDFDTPLTESWFGYRLTKVLSIAASIATSKFNQLMVLRALETPCSPNDMKDIIKDIKLAEFDCKAWNVPTYNDVFAWFLYRQIDCVRNSKQMLAQTFFSQKELNGLHTDECIKKVKDELNVGWDDFNEGMKYGRFVYKKQVFKATEEGTRYCRNEWCAIEAFPLFEEYGKTKFKELNIIPILNGTN